MRPQLGSLTLKEVTIDKNDHAEGIIEFTGSLLEVPEDIGTVTIPVVRGSGTFGRVSAFYSVQNVTAMPDGVDYILTDGEVVFLDGQSEAYIRATIINDQIKEFSETFSVTLTDPQGGAILGSNITEVIAISKSDGPDGLIGFAAADLRRIIENPANSRDLSFSIELSGGTDEYLTGTEVRWHILGPNSEDVLMETDDIATPDGRLQGSVTFEPQTRGFMRFTLQVRPYFGPEVQEIYKVDIYQVVGAGEVVRDRKSTELTILKHGDPNGIIQFDESSVQPKSFDEPNDGSSPTSVSFRVERKEGAVGDIQVTWEVRDMANNIVTTDVNPTNGTLDFSSGTALGDIQLSILPDSEPELEESFQLILVSSQGGADINSQLNVARFSVRPNDDPHGVFSVLDGDQQVLVGDELNRFLRIQILREGGTLGSVQVNFGLNYNDGVTGAYVPTRGTVTCRDGGATCSKDIGFLNNDVFLERGTTFTVNLTSVSYIGSGVTIEPIIDRGRSSAVLRVPQAAANSKVGFLLSDIEIMEDNYQVMLTVSRIGAYGDVDVNWEAGYPSGSVPSGFTEGIITPRSGQVRFTNGQSRRTVTVGLTPMGIQEVFALHISSIQSPSGVSARLDDDRSIIEIAPSGLISFSQSSRDVQAQESEGEVTLTIQRQLGAQGLIRVNYQTTSGSAIPGEDYIEISGGSVTLSDDQQSGTIIVRLLAENNPELAKTFYVNITSVQRLDDNQAPEPLLSTLYSVAMVTIEANNDPFGIFSISPVLVETTESEGTCKLVEMTITRSGGMFGDVSLMVRTVGGGEPWESDIITQSTNETNTIGSALITSQGKLKASSGSDYEELQETLIFRANEDTDVFRLSVCDDNEPEPDEHFYVYLTVISGGARVAGSGDSGLQGYAEVIILGNDNYNGIIGFSVDSLFVSVSEDVSPTVTLILDRGDAYFEGVVVRISVYCQMSIDSSFCVHSLEYIYLYRYLYRGISCDIMPVGFPGTKHMQ
ncbi:G-protein coupled receptor 98 [Holothuria leucospilota]|uniref:G-protein coupled receptor 98 n=1 Tax=Holothuria leucospilota TaxID=206669 RepID=A0A9Q0YBI6_HOLLE|nr:G-protein coupled receptor 98 [Holothuria leucospilota]